MEGRRQPGECGSGEAVVELAGVRFSYGATPVLRGVDMRLGPGELCALVGPNGAGKSTVVRLILGEVEPSAGDVRLFGSPVTGPCAQGTDWTAVGYVPQRTPAAYGQFPATVAEVVASSVVRRHALSGRLARERMLEALRQTGVEDLAGRMIGRLSGGQLQRVMLARSLVNDPRLLVLDEPTTGLDAESTAAFYRTVERQRAERNVAVLLVTHDLVHVPRLHGRTLRLQDGRVREVGAAEVAMGAGVPAADSRRCPTCADEAAAEGADACRRGAAPVVREAVAR